MEVLSSLSPKKVTSKVCLKLHKKYLLCTQWETCGNTFSIWSPQINCNRYNDVFNKEKKKEKTTAATMYYSLDGDAGFFDIVTGVLQRYALTQFLSRICLDYVFRTSIDFLKENSFTVKRKKVRRQYHAETITDADYKDDLLLLANTPALVGSGGAGCSGH